MINDTKTSSDKKPEVTSVKPLQSISYAAKIKNDNEWGKQNLEYFINAAAFRVQLTGGRLSDMQSWYNAYNNRIDEKQYNYVTNPFNTTNELYKQFPARIRSYNILRPSIDLLIGEYSKRRFKYDVVNIEGEDVMNSYTEAKYQTFKDNLTKRAEREILKAQGQPVDPKQLPDPSLVVEDLNTNYKDLKAIKGYKALRLIEFDHKLKEKFKDQFKHFLLSGETLSLKYVKRSDIEFEGLSPMWGDTDKSPLVKNFEDGSYACVKFRVTVADLVDMFYDELKESHLKQLEEDENAYRSRLYTSFVGVDSDTTNPNDSVLSPKARLNKVDLYYCTWKSRRKFGVLTYPDSFTGEMVTDLVDEDYVVDKEGGESVEWMWGNEVWDGWRINDDKYIGIGPIIAQRNEMNNFSSCKLPINGRRFSDMESANVSVLSLGMPYQIMYIIMNYRIELTIARSKGKILLLDQATIDSDGEEASDKKFYYAEALGYLLLDRTGPDVDRMWSQYTVQDMSLFDQIAQMIKLAQFYKDSWDELLGITRQRKGDITSSDGKGTTEESVFRSSVVSDIIFSTFDEYVESELQGLMDISKFAWRDGKMGYYRNDDGRMELFKVDAEDWINANYGVFVDAMSRMNDKMETLKGQINAVAQRKDIKLSTIADMIFTDSYAELKAKLKEAEAIEAEIINQTAENEHQKQVELQQMQKDYMEYETMLEIEKQERDWDRKDNNEYIKGEIAGRVAKAPSGMDIDMTAIVAESNKRLNDMQKVGVEREKIFSAERIAKMKDKTEQKKIATSLKNKVVGE